MHHLLLILVLSALPVSAAERWEELPPTPAPIHSERSGQANTNGISIHSVESFHLSEPQPKNPSARLTSHS